MSIETINHCLAVCHEGEIRPDTITEKKFMDTSPADNSKSIIQRAQGASWPEWKTEQNPRQHSALRPICMLVFWTGMNIWFPHLTFNFLTWKYIQVEFELQWRVRVWLKVEQRRRDGCIRPRVVFKAVRGKVKRNLCGNFTSPSFEILYIHVQWINLDRFAYIIKTGKVGSNFCKLFIGHQSPWLLKIKKCKLYQRFFFFFGPLIIFNFIHFGSLRGVQL